MACSSFTRGDVTSWSRCSSDRRAASRLASSSGVCEELASVFEDLTLRGAHRLGRNAESDDHASDGRVCAALQDCDPQRDPGDDVGGRAAIGACSWPRARGRSPRRRRARAPRGPPREDREYENRPEIIDDRERGEKNDEPLRNALSKEAHDSQREGDIGRHGSPPARARRVARDGQEEQCWSRHTADRRHHGQESLTKTSSARRRAPPA